MLTLQIQAQWCGAIEDRAASCVPYSVYRQYMDETFELTWVLHEQKYTPSLYGNESTQSEIKSIKLLLTLERSNY